MVKSSILPMDNKNPLTESGVENSVNCNEIPLQLTEFSNPLTESGVENSVNCKGISFGYKECLY